ncbi:MAG: ZIP family metal transporter [Deltaproteobacteria bacterium]|nr:ZIP family metal transporter [Deltaproteobacteria bacterium]
MIEQLWIPLILASLAGLATGIGSLIVFFIKDFKRKHLSFFLGMSAGVMVYVSFAELLGSAILDIGFMQANFAFFAGIIFIMLVDFIIPHNYIEERACKGSYKGNKKLMSAGIFTAIGIAIHNIPEGIAVSKPIFYATKSKKRALKYSLASGVAEPIGAVIGFLILAPFISPWLVSFMLAFVGGIMVFISFDELLPLCFENGICSKKNKCRWKAHIPILGIIVGMVIMAISLHLL